MNKIDLIKRGYFPKELPPPFTTTLLADLALSSKTLLNNCPKKPTKLYYHNHIRYGSLRRKLGIPNPTYFLQLSDLIYEKWPEIQQIISKSKYSKSKPIYTPLPQRNRSISPALKFDLVPVERAKNRITGRYILKTDISQFYQSIYTHSIPWAVHGKVAAKKERNDTTNYFGNKLDKLLRNSQDGQTLGIPIGPDTSLVIAELLLCTADVELEKRLNDICTYPFKGFRYSDDYEFTFQNLSDAESALSQIQQVVSKFELTINPDKTFIVELPCSLDSIWVLELSEYKFNNKKLIQMQDIVRYFDKAFQLLNDFPKEPVLKYAVSRIVKLNNLHPDNWFLLESLLLQSITIDPSTLRDSLYIVQGKQDNNFQIDLESLEKVLNFQISRYATLGYSSEVAWAIWSAIVFNLPISKLAAESISQMSDSVVALLALDARRRGRINQGLDTTKWEQFLVKDELYGEQWLLSYEANQQGYLSGTDDYVASNSWFSQLKNAGVSFYDINAPLIIPPNENSGPSGED